MKYPERFVITAVIQITSSVLLKRNSQINEVI